MTGSSFGGKRCEVIPSYDSVELRGQVDLELHVVIRSSF